MIVPVHKVYVSCRRPKSVKSLNIGEVRTKKYYREGACKYKWDTGKGKDIRRLGERKKDNRTDSSGGREKLLLWIFKNPLVKGPSPLCDCNFV